MLSPLSREASVGMLFTKATHCEKSLEYASQFGVETPAWPPKAPKSES